MSTKPWAIRAGVALLALLGACTQRTGQATTNKETPGGGKEAPAVMPPPAGGALDQIPSSAFVVAGLTRPDQSVARTRELLTKMGISLDTPDIQQGLAEIKADLGVDLFDADLYKKLGIDITKGMALGVDGELTYKEVDLRDYAALVEIERKPAVYAVFAVSDPTTFETWAKATAARLNARLRFEEGTLGDKRVLYLMEKGSGAAPAGEPMPSDAAKPMDVAPGEAAEGPRAPSLVAPGTFPPPPPPAVEPDELAAALVYKGSYLFVFFFEDLEASPLPEIPDPIAAAKADLKGFFEKAPSPITSAASFQAAAKHIDVGGDSFFYLDGARIEAFTSKNRVPEYVYLPAKDDSQRQSQESERSYQAERAARGPSSDEIVLKQVAAAMPAFGMSFSLEAGKASLKGVGVIGAALQPKVQKVLTPTATVPAYGTLFPEATTFFYRYSLNPLALKELVFELIPAESRAEAEAGWRQVSAEFATASGLDLERDVLGGFSGHFAFGAPSAEALAMPFMAMAMGGAGVKPVLPQMMVVMQVTSPDAGDRILSAVEKGLKMIGQSPKPEEAGGDKLYSLNVEGLTISFGRAGDLLFLGADPTSLKDAFTRAKSPGASFADKLGSPLAKDLITHKSASGVTFNLGTLLTFAMAAPGVDATSRDILAKLTGTVGTTTFDSCYEEGAVLFSGEVTLK
jgi:hypothetical protein